MAASSGSSSLPTPGRPDDPRPLEVELGTTRTIRVVASPKTSFSLSAPAARKIIDLVTQVEIRGACTGFTESKVPATLAVIVRRSDSDMTEHVIEGEMQLSSDRKTFEFLARGEKPK